MNFLNNFSRMIFSGLAMVLLSLAPTNATADMIELPIYFHIEENDLSLELNGELVFRGASHLPDPARFSVPPAVLNGHLNLGENVYRIQYRQHVFKGTIVVSERSGHISLHSRGFIPNETSGELVTFLEVFGSNTPLLD